MKREQLSIVKFGGWKRLGFPQQRQKHCILRNLSNFPSNSLFKCGAKNYPLIIISTLMIHLSSPSLASILINSKVQNHLDATTYNDQESYNNSISQNQSQSFQSLTKKDEQDSATRNTQWSENQKDTPSTSKINIHQNHSQNQNSQKITSFTTIWKFHDESTQPLEILEEKKIYTQKINSIKKRLLESRNQKIKKFRNLLPYFYNENLPKELKKVLKIADQIDKYLVEKKNAGYTENVQNILKSLFFEEEMSSTWSIVKKLLFISGNYYKIRIDCLRNLCLGFPNKKDNNLSNRKERLRKDVVDYYLDHKKTFSWENIPEILTQPTKTMRFYPQNLNITPKVHETKLDPEYLARLRQRVKKRELILLQKNESSEPASPCQQHVQLLPTMTQLESFCDLVSKIYAEKNVSHMYKVSLVENLRKKKVFTLEKVFSLLKFIQEEGIFLQVLIKSGCQILRINQKEKESLIEISKMKMSQIKSS